MHIHTGPDFQIQYILFGKCQKVTGHYNTHTRFVGASRRRCAAISLLAGILMQNAGRRGCNSRNPRPQMMTWIHAQVLICGDDKYFRQYSYLSIVNLDFVIVIVTCCILETKSAINGLTSSISVFSNCSLFKYVCLSNNWLFSSGKLYSSICWYEEAQRYAAAIRNQMSFQSACHDEPNKCCSNFLLLRKSNVNMKECTPFKI